LIYKANPAPIIIGDHIFHFKHRAERNSITSLGMFECSHCGERRIMAVELSSIPRMERNTRAVKGGR
jgi:hypothetical protein